MRVIQRNTKQKEIILETLYSMKNHPTAEEVYNAVTILEPHISRSTVFRVLNQLAENGSALKISLMESADRFDFNVNKHSHAICIRCKKVFDLPYIAFPLEYYGEHNCNGFHVIRYSIMFEGYCEECKKISYS